SISMGILMLPFLYLLGKELADRRVGLVAMILGGVGYWPDMISRIGLRFPLAMLFTAATLYFFFRALRRRRWNDFLWAGLALGIGMYGYTPIRIVPVALAVVAGLFLIHPSSKGSRGWAVLGFLVTMATVAMLFIPFLRYAVDFPGDFWLRTITRIVPSEGPLQNPVGIFFSNVKNALLMFSWNDGVGWFNCVPLRPALDIVTGGLFALGVFGMAVHTIKKRSWEAASLILLIPVLLLPSIMALGIPDENPHLARAAAAIPITFLLPAFAFVLILDYLKGLAPGRNGWFLAALAAATLIFFAARQDFDLTQRQYPAVYRGNSQNASEIGTFMLKFDTTIGRPEDAYLIPYPYWVDDRIVNVYAGFPILSHHIINPEDIPGFAFSGRPTVFLLLAEDKDDLHALQEKFPTGYYGTVVSAFPGKDFVFYLVPGTPIAANP
ncbi:MAG: glycosyltransferase family 39 protein, partial [Anaerolineales bacterium]